MEQSDSISSITISSLIAYCINKILIVLVGAFLGTSVVLGFHLLFSNSEKNTTAYNETVSRYNNSINQTEIMLENLKAQLDFIEEEYAFNPILSGEEVFCARVVFSVDSKNGLTVTQNGTIVSELAMELSTIWEAFDIASVVGSSLDSKVLKTFMSYSSNGLMHEIIIYADSIDKANEYANKVLDYLVSYISNYKGDTVAYKAIEVTKAEKETINSKKQSYIEDRADLISRIEKAEDDLKDLRKAPPVKYHFLRYSVLGFLAGAIITILIISVLFVFRNPLTNTFVFEQITGIPFLGALFIENGLFAGLARRVVGERMFVSENEELAFIHNTVSSSHFCDSSSPKRIIIISSINKKTIDSSGKRAKDILADCGFSVEFIPDSTNNPLIVDAIERADAVVLLECQWKSRMHFINSSIKYVSDHGKQILGFIIC